MVFEDGHLFSSELDRTQSLIALAHSSDSLFFIFFIDYYVIYYFKTLSGTPPWVFNQSISII